jgi:hypothetical protein
MVAENLVNVPRVTLREWAGVLAVIAQDKHLGVNARGQLAVLTDQIAYWGSQRTDIPTGPARPDPETEES